MEMNRRYSIWRDGDKHKDMEGGGVQPEDITSLLMAVLEHF